MTDVTTEPATRLRPLGSRGRRSLLWQMIGLAVIVHIIVLVALSPKLLWSNADSPEKLFEQGQAELDKGNYDEATALFEKVMKMQPKVPPVFQKAAEQHQIAERLAKQAAANPTTGESAGGPADAANTPPTANGTPNNPVKTPATAKTPATKSTPFVPPELRRK